MGKVRILVGDITSDDILKDHDAIVNPTNPRMICGSGVSGAVFHKAGVDKLENYTQTKYNISYFTNDNLMQIGEVRITPGFNLGLDIIFAQGPKAYEYEYSDAKILLLYTYYNIIESAYKNGYKKILCPSLGTGEYCFKHQDIAKDVVETITKIISDKDIDVDLVLYTDEFKSYYESYIRD